MNCAVAYCPTSEERAWFGAEVFRIGISDPTVLDPTAGGGSIPFEASRLA